jgi:hypothetical protein
MCHSIDVRNPRRPSGSGPGWSPFFCSARGILPEVPASCLRSQPDDPRNGSPARSPGPAATHARKIGCDLQRRRFEMRCGRVHAEQLAGDRLQDPWRRDAVHAVVGERIQQVDRAGAHAAHQDGAGRAVRIGCRRFLRSLRVCLCRVCDGRALHYAWMARPCVLAGAEVLRNLPARPGVRSPEKLPRWHQHARTALRRHFSIDHCRITDGFHEDFGRNS